MTKFTVILSGKGGAGKTTSAINLAFSLIKQGHDTVLIDGNLSTPNISLHLGDVSHKATFHDVIEGRTHVFEAIKTHSSGLKYIPADLNYYRPSYYTKEQIEHALLDMEGHAERIIIDTSAGISDETSKMVHLADEALIVTNPDLISVISARKAIKLAHESGSKILGIIVNKYMGDSLDLSMNNIENLLDHPVIGIIPFDSAVREALYLKHPVCYSHPNSYAAKSYQILAKKIKNMF